LGKKAENHIGKELKPEVCVKKLKSDSVLVKAEKIRNNLWKENA